MAPRIFISLIVICQSLLLLSSNNQVVLAARQYLIEKSFKTFDNAETFCVNKFGTHLASIIILDDQVNAETIMRSANISKLYFGLNDITNERGRSIILWQYKSGLSQNVEFWATNQPEDGFLRVEDCAALDSTKSGRYGSSRIHWTANDCDEQNQFICDDNDDPRYIAVLNQELTFADAQNFCRANFNSNLATVRNANEQLYLSRLIANFKVWVGFNDLVQDGNFTWNSRITTTFTNFASSQPSGLPGEQCVEVDGSNLGLWNDVSCFEQRRFLCDKNFVAKIEGVTGSPAGSTLPPTPLPPITNSPTTKAPTLPTKSPTKSPTTSPTRKPTRSPTKSPTSSPTTSAPTNSPTLAPTNTPTTDSPSSSPTPIRVEFVTLAPTLPEKDPQPKLLVYILGGGTAVVLTAGFAGLALVWRQEKRRLRFQELRDTALAASNPIVAAVSPYMKKGGGTGGTPSSPVNNKGSDTASSTPQMPPKLSGVSSV